AGTPAAGTPAAGTPAAGTPAAGGSAAPSAEAFLNALAQLTLPAASADVNAGVALALINPLIARVMPTPAYALPASEFPLAATTGIATQIVHDGGTAVGDSVPAAVAAALPATTASVVLQAPQSFVAVAGAAHSVAQAAWLASTEDSASPAGVIAAAQEAAAAVKTANPGSTSAINAARAVAAATRSKAGATHAADVAAAAALAVSKAVQTALNLPPTNGAITALAAAETVVNAAWSNLTTAAGTTGGATGTTGTATGTTGSAAGTTGTAAGTTGATAGTTGDAAGPTGTGGQSTQSAQAAAVELSNNLVSTVAAALPSLTLYAANPGEWANGSLTVSLNTTGITSAAVASMGLVAAPGNLPFSVGDVFNLQVGYTAPDGSTMSESWPGVSLRADAGSQRIDRVLGGSNLIQYIPPGSTPGAPYPTTPPGSIPVSGAYGVAGIAVDGTDSAPLQGTASQPLTIDDYLGSQSQHTGLYALDHTDQFDILCIPPDQMIDTLPPALPPKDDTTDLWRMELYQTAAQYCQQKRALLIIDPPSAWAQQVQAGSTQDIDITTLGTYATEGEYAAVYFPYLVEGNPLLNGQLGYFAPSGAIAGVISRTDASRGVWKAPAGITDGALSGTLGLQLRLSDVDNGLLNPQGINCLRTFPVYGNVVWGARTLKGADVLNDDYKYVPVRRLAMYIEDSLLRGMQWAVFEPNAEPLWASIRLSVGSFMNMLYRQGAFAGATAKEAYYVACDATTTTQDEINQGIVNVLIGFAPLKPAEFVVITIQQMAGQTPA
ncbi:MAG TPA: phage tail sheath C-terminal domain-containing protein, partial [Longimicrobium sp.]|nr:phage tail sheath C-terminal domain-containing protein [Longimicrobium sp.]